MHPPHDPKPANHHCKFEMLHRQDCYAWDRHKQDLSMPFQPILHEEESICMEAHEGARKECRHAKGIGYRKTHGTLAISICHSSADRFVLISDILAILQPVNPLAFVKVV
jgi:hypothetical protein